MKTLSFLLTLAAAICLFPACKTEGNPNYDNISVATFEEMRTRPNTVVLDVRTADEYAAGAVPGAQHLDYESEDFRLKARQLPRDMHYLIYCRSGNRSNKAAIAMSELGFDHLHNLQGGYQAWSSRVDQSPAE